MPPSVAHVLRDPGDRLDRGVRNFMESRFGEDFGGVRIHTDGAAAASARDVHAQAYTVGRHVVFGAGRYAPATAAGQRLIAHELTHVVQQRHGLRAETAAANDAAEAEALVNEGRVHESAPLTAVARSAPPLARRGEAETTVTVTPPAHPMPCTQENYAAIFASASLAMQWLDRAVDRLRQFIAQPGERTNADTGAALEEYFRSRDPAIVQRVLNRVAVIRNDIGNQRTGTPLRTTCEPATDRECAVGAGAYVTTDRERLSFCPSFFSGALEWRATTIVHEMAHSIETGPARHAYVTDRGYQAERVTADRFLTTPEALTNAESYALLVQHLGSGQRPARQAPQDPIARECDAIAPRIRAALARAERWNRSAQDSVQHYAPADLVRRHLGNDTPAIRIAAQDVYTRAITSFAAPIDIACSRDCGARMAFGEPAVDHGGTGTLIGLGIGAGLGAIAGGIVGAVTGSLVAGLLVGLGVTLLGTLVGALAGVAASRDLRIQVCPSWKDLPERDRIEWILRAAYEAFGHSAADSLKYARLAGALQDLFSPVPTLEQIDRDFAAARLQVVQARLGRLRAEYQRSSDAFAASGMDERQRESVARGERDIRRQTRSDAGDRELLGGRFAGDRIRRVVQATTNGTVITLSAPIQLTYQALSAQDAEREAAADIPRIAEAIRTVWEVDITQGEYAGVHFQLVPSVTHLPLATPRAENAFLIQVRAPDTGPSSGDAVSGIVSLAPVHLQGARVIVVAHELAHLFGFTDAYLSEFRRDRQGRTTERMAVGRADPANRPDLLGMIDPVLLERKRREGAVSPQDFARQTRPVRVWEEEAVIVLRTLGVSPPPPARPTPDSENFDPDVELGRVQREGDARLADIRRRRARIDETIRSVELAEEIIRLEAEENALIMQLAAPVPASAPAPAPAGTP